MPEVKAVGAASGRRSNLIEEAMVNAIKQVEKDTAKIAADPKLSEDQKQKMIASINEPSMIKDRMMKAREAAQKLRDKREASASESSTAIVSEMKASAEGSGQ